jgi:hypothetical protein
MLPRPRRIPRNHMMRIRRRTDVHDINVGGFDELPMIGEHARNVMMLGKPLRLFPRPRTDRRELDLAGPEVRIVDGVEIRSKPRPDNPNPKG